MKKFLITGLSVLFVALALFSCSSKDEPKEEQKPTKVELEVLLNGVAVKNGAEVSSKTITPPAFDGLEYQFVNEISFKANNKEQLGKYSLRIKKIGGDNVLGKLVQVCKKLCKAVMDNIYEDTVEFNKLNENIHYEVDYSLGTDKPAQMGEAKLLVELKRNEKLIHQFTIKMTYKP